MLPVSIHLTTLSRINVRKTAETWTLTFAFNSMCVFLFSQLKNVTNLNSQTKVNKPEQQKMSARSIKKCCTVKADCSEKPIIFNSTHWVFPWMQLENSFWRGSSAACLPARRWYVIITLAQLPLTAAPLHSHSGVTLNQLNRNEWFWGESPFRIDSFRFCITFFIFGFCAFGIWIKVFCLNSWCVELKM